MFFFTSILDIFINRYDFNADISCVDRFTEVYTWVLFLNSKCDPFVTRSHPCKEPQKGGLPCRITCWQEFILLSHCIEDRFKLIIKKYRE